jgi:hypothetical protein
LRAGWRRERIQASRDSRRARHESPFLRQPFLSIPGTWVTVHSGCPNGYDVSADGPTLVCANLRQPREHLSQFVVPERFADDHARSATGR